VLCLNFVRVNPTLKNLQRYIRKSICLCIMTKKILSIFTLGLILFSFCSCKKAENKPLENGRFLSFCTIIRYHQIEITREKSLGWSEVEMHSVEKAKIFREKIYKACPTAKITWAFSWLALTDKTARYSDIRKYVAQCVKKYGDEMTFIPGAYFPNAYNSTEQVNKDMHDALKIIEECVGDGYRPKAIIAGFLSSKNQKYLAEKEGIHVCQGNIFSQYAIDNQDGDGSPCYPYYPSIEHFCKPAQNDSDFVDCVNLDGWTVDFLAGRREGFAEGFNSRMGVGPIETVHKFMRKGDKQAGIKKGLDQMMHTTATHFDTGFKLNGFAWIVNWWEHALPLEGLEEWISMIMKRWPDTKIITHGEFGMLWREQFKHNDFDYKFIQTGSGIDGSDADKVLYWYMNKDFRLAILKQADGKDEGKVIDFTRYDKPAQEPTTMTRKWSLLGDINQKQTRPQDKPVKISELPRESQEIIKKRYPELIK